MSIDLTKMRPGYDGDPIRVEVSRATDDDVVFLEIAEGYSYEKCTLTRNEAIRLAAELLKVVGEVA